MRLLLIRHGQTPSNIKGLLDTAVPGPELTRLGHEQARALPSALAEEPIEALYASTAIRTQLTASPLAGSTRLDVGIRDGLREISAGEYEMLGDGESIAVYLRTVFAWTAGELDRRMPGGPDGFETFGRFDDVVAEAEAEGLGTVALFSHGAMIRSWAGARAKNLDAEFAARNILSNTGVVVLEGSGSTWEAVTWMGEAVGGPAVEDTLADGPAGDSAAGVVEPGSGR
ncbi:histidine phosphatase family protein [Arthrobacter mangrovi]|uniref:Isomerase n=1 Tax=Arthrobacter mangrovi TaxID=2966350 RepID=A0ABQ5MU95_9MICC|nr:histidine phosphatase family protein [Arthrobacter mangrovi]GLB67565.1 isomerase [Arthrobacter mangrovi]